MNLPVILDIAIGLVFIYLIASLLASEIQELLAALLQWRAKHLKESIQNLLSGGYGTQDSDRVTRFLEAIYNDPLLKNMNQSSRGLIGWLGEKVYQFFYETTKVFRPNKTAIFGGSKTAPSYISSETFATSLLEQVGMASLIDKLTQIRLEKFIGRIVGLYTVTSSAPNSNTLRRAIEIPPTAEFSQKDNWEKGAIRVLAEEAKALAKSQPLGETARAILTLDKSAPDDTINPNFMALVAEYDDVLMDFQEGQITIQTAVERMQWELEKFIDQITILTGDAQATATNSTTNQLSVDQQSLIYFQKRLKTLNLSIFGKNSSRAIASGKLRPSLLEIAEVLDRSSMTYEEIERAFQGAKAAYAAGKHPETVQPVLSNIVTQVNERRLRTQVVPEAAGERPDTVPIYQQITIADLLNDQHDYDDEVKATLKTLYAKDPKVYQEDYQAYQGWKHYQQVIVKVIQDLAKQLQDKEQLFDPQNRLLLARLPQEITRIAPRERDKYVVKQLQDLNPTELVESVKYSFRKLFSEERQRYVNTALSNLSLEQRQIYKNYQTYDQIQDFLDWVPAPVKESLAILAKRAYIKAQGADQQLNQFKEEVSVWFDRSMSRASGVYKRNAKLVAITIGILIALIVNIDTFHILSRLSNDESLRQVVVQEADRAIQQANSNNSTPAASPLGGSGSAPSSSPIGTPSPASPPPTSEVSAAPANTARVEQASAQEAPEIARLRKIKEATGSVLEDVALPIQWTPVNLRQQLGCKPSTANTSTDIFSAKFYREDCFDEKNPPNPLKIFGRSLRMLLGWVISGLAIAMGAPFWFDLLSKIMNVRNTGSRPASTTDKQNSNPPS